MKLNNKFDDLEHCIQVVAKKFSHTIPMEYDDLVQELWCFALEKDFSDIRIAVTSLYNKAREIYRYYANPRRIVVISDSEVGYAESESDRSGMDYLIEHGESATDIPTDYNVQKFLSGLKDDKRIYVVSKAYLSGDYPELEKEYSEIVKGLSEDKKKELLESKKKDDLIAKYLLGCKSGNHSGSFINLKSSIKGMIVKDCIY